MIVYMDLENLLKERISAKIRRVEYYGVAALPHRNIHCHRNRLSIPGDSEPLFRRCRLFRNYPFLPFYIIGNIV